MWSTKKLIGNFKKHEEGFSGNLYVCVYMWQFSNCSYLYQPNVTFFYLFKTVHHISQWNPLLFSPKYTLHPSHKKASITKTHVEVCVLFHCIGTCEGKKRMRKLCVSEPKKTIFLTERSKRSSRKIRFHQRAVWFIILIFHL